MVCRDVYKNTHGVQMNQDNREENDTGVKKIKRLLFGVESAVEANDNLQNNLSMFEWVTRNKLYPNFWGRNINGENALTKEEIDYLHDKGCKIAAIYRPTEAVETEEQGQLAAKRIDIIAIKLGIPMGTAIFLQVEAEEHISADYMRGYAETLISNGYVPGFKAYTDARYDFDHEFSRGKQSDEELFNTCLIWANEPNYVEYDRTTNAHVIHPEKWAPYAPSGMTRDEIAIWQYGCNCHPIQDDIDDKEVTFNLNLVWNQHLIIENMF